MTVSSQTPAPAKSSGQIASVQVLRAIAALTVVFGHAQHDALISAGKTGFDFARNHLLPWGAGVDLFFVISGFIMVHASSRLFATPGGAREFLRRRLIRIVPLYWLLSAAYLLLGYGFGASSQRAPLDAMGLITSFFFWPLDLFSDGAPRPYFTLGWTLNYEMFFYVVFAAFLALERARAVAAVSLCLVVAVGAAALVPPAWVPLRFWAQPIVLEFVMGMGLALAWRAGWRMPRALAFAVVALALGILIADPMGAAHKPEDWITPNDGVRLTYWGIPAALVLSAFVLARPGTPTPQHNTTLRFWTSLGDASYALYLVHPFVVVGGRKLWLAAGLHKAFGFWTLVTLELVLAIVAAFLVHRWLEKPLTALLQNAGAARAARQPEITRTAP